VITAVDWYFDFVSPFAYLASQRIHVLVPREVELRLKPVLFAGLLRVHGHKGPAEIPAKRRFTYRQALWQAEQHGIPMRFPPAHPFNPLAALRLAVALDCRPEVVDRIFAFIWIQGRDPDTERDALAEALGLDTRHAGDLIAAPEVKAKLAHYGEEAAARGVFGVPTLAIGDELFWGFDALEPAMRHLHDPHYFLRGEYARLAHLPVGAARGNLHEHPQEDAREETGDAA
jgi:2-hydroxychromene-2-carboxylate isomerase